MRLIPPGFPTALPHALWCSALLGLASAPSARAAEVVWVGSAPEETRSAVAELAEAEAGPLEPVALRGATAGWGSVDDDAIETLEATLRDVREFETRLDGELIIMQDLQAPIDSITALRNEADRERLFSALAYQGFAVDRFFADALADDERAAAYRTTLGERVVERPWLDALALDPTREVTPYDIAEAPQRVAFHAVQDMLEDTLPARIVPMDLPEEAQLVVDGQDVELDRTGTLSLSPGRHLVHIEEDGFIVARYDLRLEPAERRELRAPIDPAGFEQWLERFLTGEDPQAMPPGVEEAVAALGGEVWLARATAEDRVALWKLDESGVRADEVELLPADEPAASATAGSLSLWFDAGYGWLNSGDFYAQDPAEVPRTRQTVNATGPGLGLGLDLDVSMLRAGLGVSLMIPTGSYHVAYTGENSQRARLFPHLRAGLPWLQAIGGYFLPYHLAVGGTASIPLVGGLELHATGLWGPGPRVERDDGSSWEGMPVAAAWGGLAWRFQ